MSTDPTIVPRRPMVEHRPSSRSRSGSGLSPSSGAPSHPTGPAPAPTLRRRSLTLAAALLAALAGPTAARADAGATREGTIHAASYFETAEGCDGGTHDVELRIEPNRGGLQVGIFESSAGAVGPQWRSAGWMAALVALEVLRADPAYRISYTLADSRIDGPSAGALTTAGVMALLTGAPLPEDVSMTGTINPDGTVGPVGGIPHKVAGAARDGKKRFALPLGQRIDRDLCTGQPVDVVALGQKLGMEVREVGDVREAYAFLTGRTLAEAGSVPPREALTLAADARATFRDLEARWGSRFEAAAAQVRGAVPGELGAELESLFATGVALREQARGELAAGHEPAAFGRTWLAVLNAEVTAQALQGLRALRTTGLPGVQALTATTIEQGRARVRERAATLKTASVASVLDASVVAGVGAHLAASLAYLDHAAELLERSRAGLARGARSPQELEDVGKLAFEALGQVRFATLLADTAAENAVWIGRGGPPVTEDGRTISSLIGLFKASALSNLEYFDTLTTAELARAAHVDLETARDRLARVDLAYLAARGALDQLGTLGGLFDQGTTTLFAQLGALQLVVANSALLVAEHYAVGAERDPLGRITGFADQAALARMTEVAEREARRAMGEAARATGGASTALLTLPYDSAMRALAKPLTPDDRANALSMLWSTTLSARLMTRLAPPAP